MALLCIGSELSTLDRLAERPRWQTLVAGIRKVYRGLLTYSGNWDHYAQVGIYDLCDLPGLCAYFPLASRTDPIPVPVALTAAWQSKRRELEAFATGLAVPCCSLEVGLPSGAAAWPWEEAAQGPVDLEEQRRCYQAFATALGGFAASARRLFLELLRLGGWPRGYTPAPKPAAEEMDTSSEAARPALCNQPAESVPTSCPSAGGRRQGPRHDSDGVPQVTDPAAQPA